MSRDFELGTNVMYEVHSTVPSVSYGANFFHTISRYTAVQEIGCDQVDSAFYPSWDGKMSTSQRAVMLYGWEVKAGMV